MSLYNNLIIKFLAARCPFFSERVRLWRRFTLKTTSAAVEKDTVELPVLKNRYMDPESVYLALLEVTLAQDSSYKPRACEVLVLL